MITCIGCGCDDYHACEGEDGEPCAWALTQGDDGICSNCIEAFDDPAARLAEAAAGLAPRWEAGEEEGDDSELILPDNPEFNRTLRGGT